MPASIFNGNAVKILKDILRFKDGSELSSTAAGYSNSLTSDVQAQLDNKADTALSNLTTTAIDKDLTFNVAGTPQYSSVGWTFGIAGSYTLTLTPSIGPVLIFNFTPASGDPFAEDTALMNAFNTDPTAIAQGWRSYNSDTEGGEAVTGITANIVVIVGPDGASFTVGITGNGALVDTSGTWFLASTVSSVLYQIKNLKNPTLAQDAATKAYVDAIPSGANTALSNLSAVAVSASLVPGTASTINLGSAAKPWLRGHFSQSAANTDYLTMYFGAALKTGLTQQFTMPSGATLYEALRTYSNDPLGLATGNITGNASSPIALETGNVLSGAFASGDIRLRIGSSTGTVGVFKFLRAGVAPTVGDVWTASANDGTGYWDTPATTDGAKISIATQSGFGGLAQVLFTSADVVFDTGTNIGTNDLVAPVTGYYTIVGYAYSPTNSTSQFILLYYSVNDGALSGLSGIIYGSADAYPSGEGATQLYLTAGDTVQMHIYANQGTADGISFSFLRH